MKTLTECTKKDKKFDTMVRDFEVGCSDARKVGEGNFFFVLD